MAGLAFSSPMLAFDPGTCTQAVWPGAPRHRDTSDSCSFSV